MCPFFFRSPRGSVESAANRRLASNPVRSAGCTFWMSNRIDGTTSWADRNSIRVVIDVEAYDLVTVEGQHRCEHRADVAEVSVTRTFTRTTSDRACEQAFGDKDICRAWDRGAEVVPSARRSEERVSSVRRGRGPQRKAGTNASAAPGTPPPRVG